MDASDVEVHEPLVNRHRQEERQFRTARDRSPEAERVGPAASYDPGMSRYLHTMLRITDPERSRAFYEGALGMDFRREMDIVRDGVKEATNYFYGFPGQQEELELTFNHDGRSYDLGTAYGHIAIGVDRSVRPYRVCEGGSRLCFVRDPADQYRVELIERGG